jgi:hypothetical protein
LPDEERVLANVLDSSQKEVLTIFKMAASSDFADSPGRMKKEASYVDISSHNYGIIFFSESKKN